MAEWPERLQVARERGSDRVELLSPGKESSMGGWEYAEYVLDGGEPPTMCVADIEALDRARQVGGVEPHMTHDPLVVLLYGLMRDHLAAGIFEKLVLEITEAGEDGVSLTNPFLGQYAENIARRLRGELDYRREQE